MNFLNASRRSEEPNSFSVPDHNGKFNVEIALLLSPAVISKCKEKLPFHSQVPMPISVFIVSWLKNSKPVKVNHLSTSLRVIFFSNVIFNKFTFSSLIMIIYGIFPFVLMKSYFDRKTMCIIPTPPYSELTMVEWWHSSLTLFLAMPTDLGLKGTWKSWAGLSSSRMFMWCVYGEGGGAGEYLA